MSSATDFSTLGRLGTADAPSPGTRQRARRAVRRVRGPAARTLPRPGVPRIAAVVVVGVLLVLWAVGAVVGAQTSSMSAVTVTTPTVDPVLEAALLAGGTQAVATGAVELVPGGGTAAGSVQAPPAFAAVEDVALHLPVAMAERVVFAEAPSAAALPLAPVGEMADNANPDGYTATRMTIGPTYAIAPPATGVRSATGMAVLLAAAGTPVVAPVQGVVDAVEPDVGADGVTRWSVHVVPQGRTDLRVVIRNIDVPAVATGDSLTVGVTPLGGVAAGAVLDAAANPLALPGATVVVLPAVRGGLGATPTPASD